VRLKVKIEGDNYIYKDVAEHSLEAEYAALVLKAASMTSVGEVPDLLPIIA